MPTRSPKFDVVRQALRPHILSLCRKLLPNGREQSGRWVVGNTNGDAGHSLSVILSGDDAGAWKDFATGETGDGIRLYAKVTGKSDAEAVDRLAEEYRITLPESSKDRFVEAYRYTDEAGEVLFEVVRQKNPKNFPQRRPCRRGERHARERVVEVQRQPQTRRPRFHQQTHRRPRRLFQLLPCQLLPCHWTSSINPSRASARLASIGIASAAPNGP